MKIHEGAIRSLTGHDPHKRKFLLLISLPLMLGLFPSLSLALSRTLTLPLTLDRESEFHSHDVEAATGLALHSIPEPIPLTWGSVLSPSFQSWRQSVSGDRERRTKFMHWIRHAFRKKHSGHRGEIRWLKRNQPRVITPEPGSGLLIATGLILLLICRSFRSSA